MTQLDIARAATRELQIKWVRWGGAEAWDTPAAATPQWTMRDIVALESGLTSTGDPRHDVGPLAGLRRAS